MTGSNATSSAPTPAQQALSSLQVDDRRKLRRRTALMAVATVFVFVASLCLSTQTAALFYPPAEALSCVPEYLALWFGSHVGTVEYGDWYAALDAHPMLYDVGNRLGVTFVTCVCGGLLACAGTLYQNVFRNPIAAPTMLGVNNGIRFGIVILVVQFGAEAQNMTGMYYLYTYGGAIIVLLAVLGCGKLISGRGAFNVVDMLLVASIISQLCGFITTYLSTYVLDDDMWEVYYNISEVLSVNTELVSFVSLGVATLAAVIPVFLTRFSMNMVSFTDEEARLSGVEPNTLRVVALVCGTVMVIAAQVHCGLISMISLVVPHVSRALFGADFRKQFWGNIIIGALVLLICRFVVGCIPFVGQGVAIGTVVSFVTLPLFVWMLAHTQKGWVD